MSESPLTSEQILAAHYAATFETESGKIVLADLEKRFYVERPAFVKNGKTAPYDVIEAAIRDGQRQAVETIRMLKKSHTPKSDKKIQTKAKR